jgi:hypothetical protein
VAFGLAGAVLVGFALWRSGLLQDSDGSMSQGSRSNQTRQQASSSDFAPAASEAGGVMPGAHMLSCCLGSSRHPDQGMIGATHGGEGMSEWLAAGSLCGNVSQGCQACSVHAAARCLSQPDAMSASCAKLVDSQAPDTRRIHTFGRQIRARASNVSRLASLQAALGWRVPLIPSAAAALALTAGT